MFNIKITAKSAITNELGNGELDGYGKQWENPVYLCPKHARKLRKMLNVRFER